MMQTEDMSTGVFVNRLNLKMDSSTAVVTELKPKSQLGK